MSDQKRIVQSALSSWESLRSPEGWAWWFFATTSAMAAFGPAIHYTGWSLALLLLLWQRYRQKTSLKVHLPLEGRLVIGASVALVLWSAAATAFTASSPRDWGHGISYFFEMAIGFWLAARLNQQEQDRKMLLRVFVCGAVVTALYFTLQELSIVAGLNQGMRNGNTLGFLGLLISVILWDESLSSSRLPYWVRSIVFTLGGSVLFLSFSSGAWGAGALQALVILRYSFRCCCKARWVVVASVLLAVLCLLAVDHYSEGRTRQLFIRELSQMASLGDFDALTTNRKDIWRVSLGLIKEHPVTGYGQDFEDAYANFVTRRELTVTPAEASHPHNMWLFVLYRAGIPGLLMFIAVLGGLLRKSWRIMKRASDPDRRWALLTVAFLMGQLFYSTNGDLFQGRRDVTTIVWVFFGVVTVMPAWRQKAEE